MAELTATGRWELEVVLTDYNNQTYTALYSDFSVGDSSTNYRLSLSGYNATRSSLPDSLNGNSQNADNLNGMEFSTKDRDNDYLNYGISCSGLHGDGGWWFNTCSLTCLTGKNFNNETMNDEDGILWETDPAILDAGKKGSWPAAKMIIRKK